MNFLRKSSGISLHFQIIIQFIKTIPAQCGSSGTVLVFFSGVNSEQHSGLKAAVLFTKIYFESSDLMSLILHAVLKSNPAMLNCNNPFAYWNFPLTPSFTCPKASRKFFRPYVWNGHLKRRLSD